MTKEIFIDECFDHKKKPLETRPTTTQIMKALGLQEGLHGAPALPSDWYIEDEFIFFRMEEEDDYTWYQYERVLKAVVGDGRVTSLYDVRDKIKTEAKLVVIVSKRAYERIKHIQSFQMKVDNGDDTAMESIAR